MKRAMTMLLLAVFALCATGCVERKLIITSEPSGARVYVDDREVGQTPVTTRFNFYGGRTFVLRKEGYRDTVEVRKVKKPFYAQPVLDAITDLGPIPLKDHQTFHFKMTPMQPVETQVLMERARRMRSQVTGEPYVPKKPPEAEKTSPKPEEKPKPAEEPAEEPDETPVEEPVEEKPEQPAGESPKAKGPITNEQ